MRMHRTVLLLAWVALFQSPGLWGADGVTMFEMPMIAPLNCRETTQQYRLLEGNAPGFLYYPGEPVNLTFTFEKGRDTDGEKYALEIQGVHTRKPNKAKTYGYLR